MKHAIFIVTIFSLSGTESQAAPWVENKEFFSENAGLASSKVDAADLNGDGTIDLVFANGAGFDKGDNASDLPQQAFINDGTKMTDISASIFGDVTRAARAVKLRDIDRDGDSDIILGTTWETQSQLYLNDGGGTFANVTAMNLPQGPASVGDLEVGDIDGDGDLDIVLTNWGSAPGQTVATNAGGITLLWRQMGDQATFGEPTSGLFEDVTVGQMPNIPVRWSWDLEFVDMDNDYDLDIIVSAYAGEKASLFLFANDGNGKFTDATAGNVPQGRNSLDVEPMDLNDDGAIDLVSLHDYVSGRNRLLLNDPLKPGLFKHDPHLLWPLLANPPSFDTMAAFYDHDSNNVPDIILGAFQTFPDRLIQDTSGNKKSPKYTSNTTAFQELKVSGGTFAIVLADFNKDTRLDVAMAQNENAFEKKVLLATGDIPIDTAPPRLTNIEPLGDLVYPGVAELRLRCHDNKSPLMLHDFKSTDGKSEGFPFMESWTMKPQQPLDDHPGAISAPGQWYGEFLWIIQLDIPNADQLHYRICATDAAGNKKCTPLQYTPIASAAGTDIDTQDTVDSGTLTSTGDGTKTSDNGDSSSLTNEESAGTTSAATTTESSLTTNADGGSPTEFTSGSLPEMGTLSSTTENSIDSGPLVDDGGCVCYVKGSKPTGLPFWLIFPLFWRRLRAT